MMALPIALAEIIVSYGDRIIPILKENGGQASAFNAGFSVSQGRHLLFSLIVMMCYYLMSAQQVVEAFQQQSDIVKVQYQLTSY